MKDFKDTRYIQLLYNKKESNLEEMEIAFEDFIQEVYKFCNNERDSNFRYFTLQYLKAFLITFQTNKQSEKEQNLINGTIYFVEAAIEWTEKQNNSISENNKKEMGDDTTQVVWTGKVIHLMEFIYGSDTLKNFNDGQVTIKEISAYFSKMLGIERPIRLLCKHERTDKRESHQLY